MFFLDLCWKLSEGGMMAGFSGCLERKGAVCVVNKRAGR